MKIIFFLNKTKEKFTKGILRNSGMIDSFTFLGSWKVEELEKEKKHHESYGDSVKVFVDSLEYKGNISKLKQKKPTFHEASKLFKC